MDAAASGAMLRAGRIALREPWGIARTNGADRFVSPWGWRQRARRRRTLRRTWRAARTAKPCGPGRRCYGQVLRRCERAQPGGRHHPIRGVREARRNGRLPGDHGISRPATAQGRPSDRHHLYAAVRFFLRVLFAQRTAGASWHPAFPAPSWIRGWRVEAKLGRNAPRGRRGVSAS